MSTHLGRPGGELTVASLDEAQRMKDDGFAAIISIESPIMSAGQRLLIPPGGPDHLIVVFDDLERDYPLGSVPPTAVHVREILEFGRRHSAERCLIHCLLGVSRSTACALAVLADRLGPGKETEALAHLLSLRPQAVPNLAVIREADKLLLRNGALLSAVTDWEKALPRIAEYRILNRQAVLRFAPDAPEHGTVLSATRGAVFGDCGTVLHHVVLSTAIQWLCGRLSTAEPLGYIDTHAMAPLNKPVEFMELSHFVEKGHRCTRRHPYRHTLGLARRLRACGSSEYYPSHVLVAALTARAVGRPLTAHLFENDGAGLYPGRRAAIQNLLDDANALEELGLSPDRFHATLAPEPGSFRVESGWRGNEASRCRALVINSDPNLLTLDRSLCKEPFAMDVADLEFTSRMLSEQTQAECAIHVSFVVAPPRDKASNPARLLCIDDDPLLDAWRKSFQSGDFQVGADPKMFEWSGFRVIMGICGRQGAVPNNLDVKCIVQGIQQELDSLLCYEIGSCDRPVQIEIARR